MKKGFTLIELLAVIVILAIILAIAIPSISGIIENAQVQALIDNEQFMVRAAKMYVGVNGSSLPANIGSTVEISLSTLQTNNYISAIKDPQDKSITCNGYVLITKVDVSNYEYDPHLKCGDASAINSSTTDGLVGYWKLNNNGIDYSSKNNIGTLNSITASQDRFSVNGKAISFNGTTSNITIPNNSAYNFGMGNFSISFWINYNDITTVSSVTGAIINKASLSANTPGFFIGTSTYGGNGNNYGIVFSTTNGSWGTGNVEHNGSYLPNTWYHVVVTRSGNIVTIYQNGVSKVTSSKAGVAVDVTSTNDIVIANGPWGYLTSSLDDIKIYNRALSADEIKEMYNVEKNVGR